MPKSKRNQQISLTKTKKKTKDSKAKLIETLQKEIPAYEHLILITVQNSRNNFLAQVRQDLDDTKYNC